ncbi:MAG: hypothetical protein KKD01_19565 [Proteobacteria bacterium]|nr:hypothetical protein [Pseudomonadota bacterium]
MILPIRLNLVRIVIKPIDRPNTVIDPDFKEPIGHKEFSVPYEVNGQLNIFSPNKYMYEMHIKTRIGDQAPVAGRIIFREKDLEDRLIVINKGDTIVSAGESGREKKIDGRVLEVRPLSWKFGKPLLTVVEFGYDYDHKAVPGGR